MTIADRLRGLARFDVLVLTALLWFMAKFIRYAFPPLFEFFQETYGVSNAAVGTAFSGFMIAYALLQFPSGVLADRLGSVRVITAGALLAAIAAVTLIVDSPFLVLVAAMVVIGAGTGVHKTVAVRLLSRMYPAQTGRALGLLDTFGAFGGVAAPAAVALAATVPAAIVAGWRLLFLVTGLVIAGFAILFAFRAGARAPENTGATTIEGAFDLRPYASLFRQWRFTTFVLVTVLFSFTYYGVVAFLPLFLAQEAGFGTATVSLLYSVLFAVSMIQLVSGEAGDRVGMLPVIAVMLTVMTIGLLSLLFVVETANLALIGGAIVCIGLGAHGYRPVRGAYLVSIVPESMTGGGIGVVRTLLMAAGAVAPGVIGFLSEIVGFTAAFWLLTASVAAATILLVPLLLSSRSVETRV